MLFPYSTERELERIPYATIGLIGVNVVVAGITFAEPELTLLLALVPEDFRWWQPLTAMFTHAGPVHLVGNMLLLWVFGSHVEDTIGMPRYLLLYLSAGLAADALQIGGNLATLGEARGLLGASGCIMGLVSIFATRYRRVMVNILYWVYFRVGTWQVAAVYVAGGYLVLDLVFGSLGFFGIHDRVAHFAHLGGFAAGIGWAHAFGLAGAAARDATRENVAKMVAAGAYTAAAAAAETALEKRPDDAELHKEAAVYFGLDDRTLSKAVHHWSQALRLWLAQGHRDAAMEEWVRARCRYGALAFGPALLFDLGVVLERDQRVAEAVEAYDAAARHRDAGRTGPTAALRMARLLERMGHVDRSREWYAYLAKAWPDSPESLEAGDALKRGLAVRVSPPALRAADDTTWLPMGLTPATLRRSGRSTAADASRVAAISHSGDHHGARPTLRA